MSSGSDDDTDTSTVDSYYVEAFKKMSKLTGEELDKELAKTIGKTIDDNIDNPNITWNKTFVNNYVKKYCPEYVSLIEEHEKNREPLATEPE